MTYEEAMELAAQGRPVRREAWPTLRLVTYEDALGGPDPAARIALYDLDNLEGGLTGSYQPYRPLEEDRVATDWGEYDHRADSERFLREAGPEFFGDLGNPEDED